MGHGGGVLYLFIDVTHVVMEVQLYITIMYIHCGHYCITTVALSRALVMV